MFAKEISDITLVNETADRLFDNITASSYRQDRTFAATLRAVLGKRLPAGASLHSALVPLDGNALTADMIAERVRQHEAGRSHAIYIVYPTDTSAGAQVLNTARAHFGEGKRHFGAYAPQEDLRVFYAKKLEGLFLTNSSGAVIFLDALDARRLHALQMMVPKYLPGLFEAAPLSPEETALLKSLGAGSHEEYERLIEQFARKLDMREEIIRSRLSEFEAAYERERIREAEEAVERYERDYRAALADLRDKSNLIREQQIILAGLRCGIGNSGSELMEYFLCNRHLSIIRVRGTEIEFIAHGYADIYDGDAFGTYAGNPNSFLYSDIGRSVSKEGMERLYRALFGGGGYRLRICAAYRADMQAGLFPAKEYVFPPESRDYLPNPHVQHFGCVGGYASRFIEYVKKGDYVGAIDQAAVSARNLNFHDSAVMKGFAKALSLTAVKCVEGSDGSLMAPREAIKKLEGVG